MREDYPHLSALIENIMYDQGCIHRYRPVESMYAKLEEILVFINRPESFYSFDAWISKLNKEEFETISAGEETEMEAIMAKAPKIGTISADDFVNIVYNHCV
jgi:hypothetical protein